MSAGRRIDLSLYLVIGGDDVGIRPLSDVVREAVEGGVTAVQLRDKRAATRPFVEQARALVALLRPMSIPLIVNDRVDVALAAGADGVHVGQDDMTVADVRRLVGPDAIVGLSVTTVSEARQVDPMLVDYAGVGPVFATPTKPDAARPLRLDGTADVCRVLGVSRVPAVAIGGISAENAASVFATGVHGIAVVSAICSAERPREAASRLASLAPRRGGR